ncbi:MAG: ABC transporter ATP-binding protein [Candidatus Heimdallarchaeota archaeon]|nr:ABC transporter ATP-binding protein [Candidatus Heimdallarchaeota archaeon]
MTNHAIEVENLKKVFRTPGDRVGNTVLNDVSFNVPRGSSVAITGENGSGKTTLLKVLATLYLPDEGKASVLGYDLVKEATLIRERISFISPGLDFQRKLTLDENLQFFAKVQDSDPENAYKFLSEMNLSDKLHERTETFSEGQKAMARLAIGLMKSSDILFLDEVTLGLDVQRREQVINYLKSQLNHKTIMMIDHDSTVIDRLCEYVLILKSGGYVYQMMSIPELLSSLPYTHEITAIPIRYLNDREIKQVWPDFTRTGGTIRFYPRSRDEAQVINTRILSSGFISRAETRAIDLNDYAMRIATQDSMSLQV